MHNLRPLALAALALGVATPGAQAQTTAQDQWYWGGQGGVLFYQTIDGATGTIRAQQSTLTFGGHWLITKRRVGLYLAYDQVQFDDGTTSAFVNPLSATRFTDVTFTTMQRVQASLLAIPSRGALQLYGGLGFALHNISNAVTTAPPATAGEAGFIAEVLPDVSSKAFAVVTAGFQWRMGRLALFGNYQYMPAGEDFLLRNAQHGVLGGLRYAVSSAHELVGTER